MNVMIIRERTCRIVYFLNLSQTAVKYLFQITYKVIVGKIYATFLQSAPQQYTLIFDDVTCIYLHKVWHV